MILSPPFLSTVSSDDDDGFLDDCLPPPVRGHFPVTSKLAWHGGVHIPYPPMQDGRNGVHAIADGKVAYLRQPSKAPNERPLAYSGSTDNGCVILKHGTSIGATGDGETLVEFYSLYMHLQQVTVNLGQTVYRKDMLGTAGVSNGEHAIHMEIVCDDDNLEKLIGRTGRRLDTSRHGRTDAVYGDIHFYLPAGVLIYPGDPPGHATPTPTARGTATSTNLYVTLRYHRGQATLTTRQESPSGEYVQVGHDQTEQDAEYRLYQTATEAAQAIQASTLAMKPPASGLFELFRFGRVINTPHETAIVPGSVPHWRKISHPGGAGWVDLNAAPIKIFSDADFPHWVGWQRVDDDPTPDSQCNSPIIQGILDSAQDGKGTEAERMSALNNPTIQQKLARTICKFPTEWEASTIDARFDWLKSPSPLLPTPLSDDDYRDLKAHIEGLCCWADAKRKGLALPSKHWHFHPKEFIRWFRRCGWLSSKEMLQLFPSTAMRPVGKTSWVSEVIRVDRQVVDNYRTPLNKACRKYGIVTPLRMAAFYANAMQETMWFAKLHEGNSNARYSPWDGRGFLQLTWPANYIKYWRFTGKAVSTALEQTLTAAQRAADQQGSNAPLVQVEAQMPSAMIDWRRSLGDGQNPYQSADAAGAYWAWTQAAKHADEAPVNIRKTQTAGKMQVYYSSEGMGKVAATVNFGHSSENYSHVNGIVARFQAYVACQMILLDSPSFPDSKGNAKPIPEDYTQRRP